ncbi:AAA family ATPase [Streptomyces sp. NBC_01217]|uniref:AAA family ATPase n=1 Tax=Streptomyces sp. NBC_01217 TaxID=2903779 RepID=UPI002E140F8D|nr:TniB family NTP-binding protein [Streptomyces sp. NBC_01217]
MTEVLPPGVLAEMITGKPPRRDTFEGWQHYRTGRGQFESAPKLTFAQWRALSPHRRSLYDLHRTATHVNLPLQETPMSLKVARLVNRRMRNNALKQKPATRAGVMVTGWGYQGKTETVCEVAASFEDAWLEMHNHLNPVAVDGTWDLHAPVAYVQTPVTAKPKSTCQAVLEFFGAPTKSMNLPQLIAQVAESLHDHGVKALILDDITRLRMHRADDQDTLDLIRAFMSMNVTLILIGVDIPGSGLLREARWDAKTRQWVMPSSEHARVHGFETTQTERRFDLVELDRFRYSTPEEMAAFRDHLDGMEQQLRLLKAKRGMLTAGGMPEYLMRRTGGVVGLLERLIEDGAQEAMDSGKELLDEVLLDEIVISLDDPGRDPDAGEVPPVPAPGRRTSARSKRGRPARNTVFDDRGPRSVTQG